MVALAQEYDATALPKLVVEQTYDNEFDKIVERKQSIYSSKSYRYRDLVQFMGKFARQTPKEQSEEMAHQKEDQATPGASNEISEFV